MEKRKIGNTDLRASVVGFGCWGLSGNKFWPGSNDKDSIDAVMTAYEHDVNFFDVAPIYGFGHSEELLGKAIKKIERGKIIIASKCGLVWDANYNVKNLLSRESILKEIDDSLKRLDVEYIDIYQLHWPDLTTSIEETIDTMNLIKDAGKIHHIGISNFPVDLANKAMEYGNIVSQQCLYNMFDRNENIYHEIKLTYLTEKEILPFCKKNNLAFFPYSPLCQGLLTGSINENTKFGKDDVRAYNPSLKGEKLKKRAEVVKMLTKIAQNINKPLSQIAINWLINNSVITSVICGALNSAQATENSLSKTWEIDDKTMREINLCLKSLEV